MLDTLRIEIVEQPEGFMLLGVNGKNGWISKADGWTRPLVEKHLELSESYREEQNQTSYDRGYEQGADARDEDRAEDSNMVCRKLHEILDLNADELSSAKDLAQEALNILE